MTFRIEVFKGVETAPYIRSLAEMRLEEFSRFPYLYVGTMEDELSYVQNYPSTPQGVIVVAFEGETIAGLYSGLPMNTPVSFLEDWSAKLTEAGLDVTNYFYLGELIIKPAFRKMGLGSQLMWRLQQEAEAMGFLGLMGITAIRAKDHPLRPQDYFDTDTVWGKFGLEKSDIVFSGKWPQRQVDGTVKVEESCAACWLKKSLP